MDSITRESVKVSESVLIPDLIAERTAHNLYTVRNESGAEVRIGALGAEGAFSPVELLQAAIAGCASLSADAQLASRLGDDFDVVTTVQALYNAEENRVEKLITQIAVDTSELDSEKKDKLIASAERVIDKLCTVKRTLNSGVDAVTEVQGHDD